MAGGNDISFRMGGDASGVLSENAKVARSQQGVNREFELGAKVSNQAANRIKRDIETQQERFKRLRSEIFRGWQQNKLSTEQYGRAIRKLEQDYKTSGGAFKRFANDAGRELDELEESTERVGGGFAAWGPRLFATLGVLSQIRSGYQEVEALIQAGEQSITGSRGSIGSLRQLADSQEQFDKLQNAARRLRLSGAVESLGEGADTVFALQSANLLTPDAEALFLQLGARQVVPDLGKFARAIRTQLAAFGRAETGDAVQIASKAFAASAFSPASVEELLEAAALPGGTARALGISDEEVLAATSLLATSTGSANIGATALRSFLSSTAQSEEFEGLGIFERVRLLASKNLSVSDLLKSPSKGGLGRKEAVRAFTDLQSQLGQSGAVLQAINRANTDRSAIDRKLRFSDPLSEAARLGQAAEARNEFTTETLAARRIITDAAEQRRKAGFAAEAPPLFGAIGSAGISALSGTARLLGGQAGEEFLLGDNTLKDLTGEENKTLDALRSMEDSTKKQTEIMERLLNQMIGEQKETKEEIKAKEGGIPVTNE